MKTEIRKLVVLLEETHREIGRAISPPTRKALAIAVIANPYAGRYSESLDDLVQI
ncbi:MAG: amino acid synthesis family protein, partial [Quisquiliibacterium sp.]